MCLAKTCNVIIMLGTMFAMKLIGKELQKNPSEKGEQLIIDITFVCRHYKFTLICIGRMHYVLHYSKTMTQACIHLGTHEHLVATCPSKDSKDMTHDIIRQEYKKMSIAITL